jgi:hypothetical protein
LWFYNCLIRLQVALVIDRLLLLIFFLAMTIASLGKYSLMKLA